MKAIFNAIRCKRNKDFVSSAQGSPYKDFELVARGFQNRLDEIATKATASIEKGQYPWDILESKILEQAQKLLSRVSDSKPIRDNVYEFAEIDILNQPDTTGLLKAAMKAIIYRSRYMIPNGMVSDIVGLPKDTFIANVNINETPTLIEIEYTFRKRLLAYSKDVFTKANFSFMIPQTYSLFECASILSLLGTRLNEFIKESNNLAVTPDEVFEIAEKDLKEKMRKFVNTLSTEQRDMLKGDFDQLLDLL